MYRMQGGSKGDSCLNQAVENIYILLLEWPLIIYLKNIKTYPNNS